MAEQIHKPEIGDLAGISGRKGVYTVCQVHVGRETADLRLTTGDGEEVKNVPWASLHYERKHGKDLG